MNEFLMIRSVLVRVVPAAVLLATLPPRAVVA